MRLGSIPVILIQLESCWQSQISLVILHHDLDDKLTQHQKLPWASSSARLGPESSLGSASSTQK